MAENVNLKSIAQALGLSPGTVSRVLNGKAKQYRISKKTVELVMNYAEKMNYSPNMLAQGLRSSTTFTIGLMIPDIANPFFSLMAKNIEKAASEHNYSILLVDAEEDIEKEKRQVRNMISRKVDGIIAAPVGKSSKHFDQIISQKIPLVFIDRYFTESNIPYISSDNWQGSYEATKLLIDSGHTNIALIKGDITTEPVKERIRGYKDALHHNGINSDNCYELGDEFSLENGYQSTIELLKSDIRPSAIFALNNLIGLGAMKAIKEEGLKIPDDISLIIFDNQPYASFLNPPVTTVKQNSEKIGELAIDYILKKIDGMDNDLESVKLPTEIIERESVRKIN